AQINDGDAGREAVDGDHIDSFWAQVHWAGGSVDASTDLLDCCTGSLHRSGGYRTRNCISCLMLLNTRWSKGYPRSYSGPRAGVRLPFPRNVLAELARGTGRRTGTAQRRRCFRPALPGSFLLIAVFG